MGLFTSIFLIGAFLKIINKFSDGNENELLLKQSAPVKNNVITNYYPLVFHACMAILILISYFSSAVLDNSKIGILMNDALFQFASTFLIVIISIINPLKPITEEFKNTLQTQSPERFRKFAHFLAEGRNWQYFKGTICLLIIAYFVYENYLFLPSLDQGFTSNISVFLIGIFIIDSVLQLIKNPALFRLKNIVRLNMLATTLKKTFFITIPTMIICVIALLILKKDVEESLNPFAIFVLIYNVLMALNEWRFLKKMQEI